jgi:hypothetical protein
METVGGDNLMDDPVIFSQIVTDNLGRAMVTR